MQTFKTLLLREWMQHRFGWLLLGSIPLAIMVPLLTFGTVEMGDKAPTPLMVALTFAAGYTFFLMVLIGGSVAFQAPGLARRDRQDRSIEFWLSLPNSHSGSIGATLLMNLWLLPLMALGLAVAGGVVSALIAVLRVHGLDGLTEMPWGTLLPMWLMSAGRTALGMVLGTLWLGPFVIGAMAASAWLKRWGVAAMVAVLGLGGVILAKVYHQTWLIDVLSDQFEHAGWAFMPTLQGAHDFDNDLGPLDSVASFGHWMLQDTGLAIGDLFTPRFAATLLVIAGCFGLMVLRRARG
jgi:hypothetical protein